MSRYPVSRTTVSNQMLIPQRAEGDGCTRVLLAVHHLYATASRVTVRDVAAVAGLAVATTHAHLLRLRKLDLVWWDEGRKATLQPVGTLHAVT